MGLSHSFSGTRSQTLSRLLDTSPLESFAYALDESATKLRDLIDAVIALLAPLASHRGLHLRANVGQTVAKTIRADSARLAQVIFHLLNRAIQVNSCGEILLVVWAQSLNPGSQRIFFGVVDTAEKAAPITLPRSVLLTDDPLLETTLGDADAYLPLCQLLAQHMRGELSIGGGSQADARTVFNAPFKVELQQLAPERCDANAEASLASGAARLSADMTSSAAFESFEPFEGRYLQALAEEGVDLHAFFESWRQAMNNDLARLGALPPGGQFDQFHGVLHRLSGAVGLVGALSLTEALRHASTSELEHNARSLEALSARMRTLIAQLEAMSRANWSILE